MFSEKAALSRQGKETAWLDVLLWRGEESGQLDVLVMRFY